MSTAILAVDQSYAAIGWAILEGPTTVAMDSGFVKYPKGLALDKLPQILKDVAELIDSTEGTIPGADSYTLALEESWLGKNFATANKLAELRGALVGLAIGRGWQVERVHPRQWQVSAGIPMRANRETVKRGSIAIARIRSQCGPTNEDECDAINIGWHAMGIVRQTDRLRRAVSTT